MLEKVNCFLISIVDAKYGLLETEKQPLGTQQRVKTNKPGRIKCHIFKKKRNLFCKMNSIVVVGFYLFVFVFVVFFYICFLGTNQKGNLVSLFITIESCSCSETAEECR